jgi:hypothetical protein
MKGLVMALRAMSLATAIMSGLFANAEAQQPADMIPDTIPDTATALKVGTAILEARYGELFRKGRPYKAVLIGDEWLIVSEGAPSKPGAIKFGGGMPELSMSRKDGRVTHIQLSR